MLDWFALAVALSLLLAGFGWLAFALSQKGRWQAGALAWLSLPYFVVAGVYIHAAFTHPEITEMRIYARWGFITIGLSVGIVLLALSYAQRRTYGRKS